MERCWPTTPQARRWETPNRTRSIFDGIVRGYDSMATRLDDEPERDSTPGEGDAGEPSAKRPRGGMDLEARLKLLRADVEEELAIGLEEVRRIAQDGSVSSHTGLPVQVRSAWLDEPGRLFLDTDLGFGLVHTLDTGLAVDAVESGLWRPETMPFAAMPERFGYRLQPLAAAA